MSATTTVYLKDVIEIPLQVQKGDFVLNLSQGVTRPQETVDCYVVTKQLKAQFENALRFIESGLGSRTSKAAYLHGSFGSGKSHFMAILSLILAAHPAARSHKELQDLCAAHPWVENRKFLLVPYHLIGAESMESAILGGYADHIRRLHPDAPLPGVYVSEGLFEQAEAYRRELGDERFFQLLNQGQEADSGWGELATGHWDKSTYEQATAAPPGTDNRVQLVSDLVTYMFPAYHDTLKHNSEAYVTLDSGLGILSRHARSLGYDAVLLFLDELILWLASRAADLAFVQREGLKLTKLVESQDPDRPIPILSFVARQRDLRELVGEHVMGSTQLGFTDALRYWDGRFHQIKLEDRNLPEIARHRLLKPRSEEAAAQVELAFQKSTKVRQDVLDILQTSTADLEDFRKLYPFSPALVETLVAVSSLLQRERTALKVMLELLVTRRETLELGQLIPVGDLFDVVSQGEEVFTEVMRINFQNARRLYHQKLLPLLEERHKIVADRDPFRLGEDPELDARLRAFRNDDRLVKTLLLSALAPEVPSLKSLTAAKLAALNHGTIKAPIPGQETALVLARVREWASQVGEIRLSEDTHNPVISMQLSGIDTEAILSQVQGEDNSGNRRRKLKELLWGELGLPEETTKTVGLTPRRSLLWRSTLRYVEVAFHNVRETDLSLLANASDEWKVILDYPFDEVGFSPKEDLLHLDQFWERYSGGARTIVWLPHFLSPSLQSDVGTLVKLDYLLKGENFKRYSSHLPPNDRELAFKLIENQRSALFHKLQAALEMAYGIRTVEDKYVSSEHRLEPETQFQSLEPGLKLERPSAPNLEHAFINLVGQALDSQFSDHPRLELPEEVRTRHLRRIWEEVSRACEDPEGRILIQDRGSRSLLREVAVPLRLGEMGETHFVLGRYWHDVFERKRHEEKPERMTVQHLLGWLDQPRRRGLPGEIAHLLILTYAAQANLGFAFRGATMPPLGVEELRPEYELHQQRLPSLTSWEEARKRVKDLLEERGKALQLPELCTGANVHRVSQELEQFLKPLRKEHEAFQNRLLSVLADLAAVLKLERPIEELPRVHTAAATRLWLETLDVPEDHLRLEALARAPLPATVHTIGASLRRAGTNLQAIREDNWVKIFQGLANVDEGRRQRAELLVHQLGEVLSADEFARPLAPELAKLNAEALQLILPPKPPARPKPEPARQDKGATVTAPRLEGRETVADTEQLGQLWNQFQALTEAGHTLEITWKAR